MVHPAYDQCIKASHLFNLLDARGVISVTERAAYIARVRGVGEGLRRCLCRANGGRMMKGSILIILIIVVAMMMGVGLVYFNQYYPYTSDDGAKSVAIGSAQVCL